MTENVRILIFEIFDFKTFILFNRSLKSNALLSKNEFKIFALYFQIKWVKMILNRLLEVVKWISMI